MSPSRLASSRSKRASRSFSRARGTISLSAKSRAVSEISRCSSVRSRSTACSLRRRRAPASSDAAERLGAPRSSGPRGISSSVPVDRRHRLDLAHGRGEERLVRAEQVVDRRTRPPRRASDLRRSAARVIDSRTPASSAGVRRPPSGETQKIVEVGGLEDDAVGPHEQRLVGAPALAIRVACMLAA